MVVTTEHDEHDHAAVHPASLHDRGALSRASIGFTFVLAADVPVLFVVLHERRDTPIPIQTPASRAPPPGDPARAPPLA